MSENIESVRELQLGVSRSALLNSNTLDGEDEFDADYAENEVYPVDESGMSPHNTFTFNMAKSLLNDYEVMNGVMSTITITEDNKDTDDDRLLIQFATDGNAEKVRELLLLRRYNTSRINDNNHDGKEINVNAVVGVIINHDNIKTTETTTTALMQACRGGHVQVVRALLMDKTMDANLANTDGLTALMVACALDHLEIVSELLSWSSLLSLSDNGDGDNDETHVAVVDVNVQDKCYGYTALIMASNKAHWDVVRVLLKHPNIDANLCCKSGYTALIMASKNGHVGVFASCGNDTKRSI